MTMSRRFFLQASFSAVASLLGQRYGTLVKALSLPETALTNAAFTPRAVVDYYEMCEGVHWFLAGGSVDAFELGEELNLSSNADLTLSDIPNLSQSALYETYINTAKSLHDNVIEAAHLLKYRDQVNKMPALMQAHKQDIVDAGYWNSAAELSHDMERILRTLGTSDKVNGLLDQVVAEHCRHLDALRYYMTPKTVSSVASETLFELPGVNQSISCLIDRAKMGEFIEATSLKYNGISLGQFDVSDPFKAILNRSANSDEAKARVAKHILWGDEGFFNFELAHKHNIEEKHFKQGLKDLIAENLQRKSEKIMNDAEFLDSDIKKTGANPDALSDEVDDISESIAQGRLSVSSHTAQDYYEYVFVPNHSDPQRASDYLDLISETLGTLMGSYGYGLERAAPHQMIIWTYKDWDGFLDVQYILDNYVKQSQLTASMINSPIRKLLDQVGWGESSIADIVTHAKHLKLLR